MPLSQWLGAAAGIDLTELPGLDNLHHPSGCIAASQELAAAHYGSDKCLFSVNGASAGVMAAIAGCVRPGDQVLFLNPFHVSAWHGLVFADAQPLLPEVWFGQRAERYSPPDIETVKNVLTAHRQNPRLAAVYITSPTYRGQAAPISDIAQLVHELRVPLIVDEAHGAHFGLHSDLPAHSVQQGADVVIHSVHKTLPGLTQTGWVHCSGDFVAQERVENALHHLQSTSPSYLLLASLDAAQAWLRIEGRDAALRALEVVEPLHPTHAQAVKSPQWDRLRHWVATSGYLDSQQLQQQFAANGYFVEYADASGVLSIFGFNATPLVVSGYLDVLTTWQRGREVPGVAIDRLPDLAQRPDSAALATSGQVVAFERSPRAVNAAEHCWLPIAQCVGRIAAVPVAPYPPGVPVVWPGQRLDRDLVAQVQWLADLTNQGAEVQGIRADGCIAVIADSNTRRG